MSSSTKDTPRCAGRQSGAAGLPIVLGLLVLVTFIGGVALNMFSIESKKSLGTDSGFRLQQLSRMGLESSFTLLRSMGTVTNQATSSVNVASGTATTTTNVTNCSYFPRTDDVKLPNNLSDTTLLSSGSVNCGTARPDHPDLAPTQDARYISTATLTDSDYYASTNLAPATTSNFKSVFPWVRYRDDQSTMDAQYGASENIQTQINQCGLSSQLNTSASSSGAPLQRYKYQQVFDGLGTSWIDMGSTSMNLYANGLTLEAWVYMNSSDAGRVWQRIFDIGRDRQDGNIVLAYAGSTGQITFEYFNEGTCTTPTSSTPQAGCSNYNFHPLSNNAATSSTTSLDRVAVPSNSGSVNDLWYYIAVTMDSGAVTNPKIRIYTQCARTTNSTTDPGGDASTACNTGTLVSGNNDWTGLRLRKEVDAQLQDTSQNENNYTHYRNSWVGKSHWGDADFKGSMRDLRVWNQTLSSSQLNQPISINYTPNTIQSSIISDATRKGSLRISPLYKFGNDRLLNFTVQETDSNYSNTWRLVSCAWNNKTTQRKTQSLRFRVLGSRRPEVLEYLPY